VILAAILASVWLAGRLLDRRSFADFGFHMAGNWWRDLGFGLFLGAALMLIIFLIELGAGWVTVTGTLVTQTPDAPFFLAILLPLIIFVAVGIYEELLSRGYHLRNIAEGLNWSIIGPRWALVIATLISSALFGLAHLANPNASFISSFNIFVAGAILLAIGYLLTGELAIPIGVHITWNFFQGNVFGFPVSGADFGSATFISIQQGGPDVWTGGAFGPEAGLLGLGAILLGGVVMALWVRWRYGRVELCTNLAAYE
jgi:membrane protease YdiL (CAAX protease family)